MSKDAYLINDYLLIDLEYNILVFGTQWLLCKYASMQAVSKYASIQVCKYTSMQVCKYASMQVCKYARIQLCNYTIMQQ